MIISVFGKDGRSIGKVAPVKGLSLDEGVIVKVNKASVIIRPHGKDDSGDYDQKYINLSARIWDLPADLIEKVEPYKGETFEINEHEKIMITMAAQSRDDKMSLIRDMAEAAMKQTKLDSAKLADRYGNITDDAILATMCKLMDID